MNKNLQIFSSPEFGQVRVVMKGKEPWFVGKDVADVLEYQNGSRDINRHVDEDDRMKEMVSDGKQLKETILINESGLYSLVLSSKLPTAKKFKHWVTSEVLPSIRKTGSYSMPKVTPNPHYRTRMVGTAIRDIGKTAESLEQVFGVRHEMALTSATSLIGEAYGIDMTPIKPLIPAVAEPTTIGTLTPKKIAEELGVKFKTGSPDGGKVNAKLAELGLQEKRGKEWHLTEKGKQYGEAKPFTQNGHSGYQIGWGKSVIELLRSKLN